MGTTLQADHPHLAELAAYARSLTKRMPLSQPIKDIVAVGSIYNGCGGEGISPRDRLWLKSAISASSELGIGWAPNFVLRQPNLDFTGEDYLDPKTKTPTDVLITCFIATQKLISRVQADPLEGILKPLGLAPLLTQSPHQEPNAWREAADRNGARMIVCFHKQEEIAAPQFEGGNYVLWEGNHPVKTGLITSFSGDGRQHTYQRDVLLRRDLYEEVKAYQRQQRCAL